MLYASEGWCYVSDGKILPGNNEDMHDIPAYIALRDYWESEDKMNMLK